MRFVDPTGSSFYYYHLGCGDIVYGDDEIPSSPPACPLHGEAHLTAIYPVIYNGTSVRDPS
jgi:hypothetical protein